MDFRSMLNIFRPERRSMSWDSTDLLDFFGVNKKAGQAVTPETALSVMAVYAAVRIIAEGMSSLPVSAFTKGTDDFSKLMKNQPDWLENPNPGLNITKQDLISQMLVSLLLRGNAYVLILRGEFNAVVGLEVLNPDAVTVRREGPRIIYTVSGKDYFPDSILHVRGLTLPGALEGLDPITHAAATIGTGLAAQEYGATYFENASLPSGFISVAGSLSEVGAKLLKKGWDRLHSGVENAGSVAVLTEGAEFKPIALTPEQTQFLEVRKFTVQDVARLFGVPPHLLADSSNSTSWGSGLAEQNTAFSRMTLTPWAERLEAGITRVLRSEGGPRQNARAFVKIHLEGFERGAYKDRIETYALGIAAGIYDADEPRAWEDLPPLKRPKPEAPTPPPGESEGDSDEPPEEDPTP